MWELALRVPNVRCEAIIPFEPMGYGLTIGQLAVRAGVNPRTIRYYEAIGLLPAPRRNPAGYRLYGPDDLGRLRFIRRARALGLSLAEIRQVLELRQAGQAPCDHVLGLLDAKLAAIERQLRELRALRRRLQALRQRGAKAARSGCICGILESGRPADGNEFSRAESLP